jgi:hypothetical protein
MVGIAGNSTPKTKRLGPVPEMVRGGFGGYPMVATDGVKQSSLSKM